MGEERAFHVDVRIVAATAKDLNREDVAGSFRRDLFYRVSTVVVPVPPLRRRREDIPLLVEHFLAPFARAGKALTFSREAMERLVAYDWPGNIRELRNLIERLQILKEGEVRATDLTPEFSRVVAAAPAAAEERPLGSLSEVERRHVERVLSATGWNKAKAARVLEVDIKTLNKKIRDFKITHDGERLPPPGRSSHPA